MVSIADVSTMDSAEPDQNQKHHDNTVDISINLDPQGYQLEVFEVSRSRSTITVLETGSGKTLIVVMLIEHIGKAIKSSGQKKLIIFLVPTIHLVNQQFKMIKHLTNFEVKEYFRAKEVDTWNLKSWEKEINDHDCKFFLEKVMQSIRESLPYADSNLLEGQFDFLEAVDLGYISPKLLELIQLFQSFGESCLVLCLIFVERIVATKVVERFVKKVPQTMKSCQNVKPLSY